MHIQDSVLHSIMFQSIRHDGLAHYITRRDQEVPKNIWSEFGHFDNAVTSEE